MGKAFEKHTRLFALPISTVLADQKAPIRAAALQALTAIATACDGIESMIPGFTTSFETSNPLQKGTLLHWLADWFKEHEPPSLDLNAWASPIVSSLDDRNSDVRKGAQSLLPTLIACAGFDFVLHQTNSLKPASRNSAVPLIQAARPALAALVQPTPKTNKPSAITAPAPPASPPPGSPTLSSAPAPKVGPKVTGVRRKLPLGSSRPESRSETPVEAGPSRATGKPAAGGIKRQAGAGAETAPMHSSLPFHSTNPDAKRARTGKDAQKWINEGGPTRKDLADLLQSQIEPHASKDLVARLFSHDHNAVNDHIQGLTMMIGLFSGAESGGEGVETVCLSTFDLPLKYASIKAHEPQPNLISKCLDVVEAVLAFLRSLNYQLTDGEALCFIPTMVFKVIEFP